MCTLARESLMRSFRFLFTKSHATNINNINRHLSLIRSFESTVDYRRQQARRTVLVHLGRSHCETDLYKMCSGIGTIANMTLYTANKKECALIEFTTEQSVKLLLNQSTHFTNENRLPCSQNPSPKNKNFLIGREIERSDDSIVVQSLGDISNVSDQIKHFWHKTKLTEIDIRLRYFVASIIEEAFSSIFVDTVCLPFGSSVSTFGKLNCDLDMVMCFEDFRAKNLQLQREEEHTQAQKLRFLTKRSYLTDRFQAQAYLKILAETLKHFMAECTDVQIILPARVPIVRFYHRLSALHCDVSMSEFKSSYYMTKLLWSLSTIDSRIAPLVFSIRCWAKESSITQSTPGPWFSNFQMTLLVLYYLQNVGIIPKLNYNNDHPAHNSDEVGNDQILLDELESIRHKKMNTLNNSSLGKSGGNLDREWPIFIENPLVPHMNASKNLVLSEGERFRQTCSKAYDILNSQDSNNTLLSLFEQCKQPLPDHLITKAYPSPLSIMPHLETDLDIGENQESMMTMISDDNVIVQEKQQLSSSSLKSETTVAVNEIEPVEKKLNETIDLFIDNLIHDKRIIRKRTTT
ncbi:unnamed protein product [Didymodactylos carnosus]|uniref:Poly(A) RNA polymerase mitochondrial-like central palm domain-containing protein n=1 Tax=Didymodactylos carnosus TaxID=1234261 RepID=A0A814AJE5_9BILA|nr:unnamed protein product [Didymodactylos carnosus]CAF0912989.1 unnamed protein product [Didymodactylos carnosus]CAF3536356.1 unnamed protein product [Didymodactylos carnosus]CAF3693692.1 unnamed protein product [Didymodactylos carnosus]